ncbi:MULTISPECIES: hypothetical protein [unclassified Flavobacterium]|nr:MULTISPECIES: hypothetical protein [unclassified Flavobacterium]
MEQYHLQGMQSLAQHLSAYSIYYEPEEEKDDIDNDIPDENAVREPEER